MAGNDDVGVYNGPRTPKGGYTSKGSGSGSGGGKGGKSSGGGTGGGGGDPYLAAQRRAEASQRSQNRSQYDSLRAQARMLRGQANSLTRALSDDGFLKALKVKLGNIGLDLKQQDKLLVEGYRARVGSLEGAADDNEAAAGDSSYAAASNRARERTQSVAQALAQGAGESDLLRAEQVSLRSWDANQQEINRSYFDTLRSVNSSLTDLNVDTKTGRANLYMQANEDREQAWTNYYNQMSETYTELGNIRGQLSQTYGQAGILSGDKNSGVKGKGDKGNMKSAEKGAIRAFNQAATFAGKAYKDPGVPSSIMSWQGQGAFEGQLGNTEYIAPDDTAAAERKRPEGATLRSWE